MYVNSFLKTQFLLCLGVIIGMSACSKSNVGPPGEEPDPYTLVFTKAGSPWIIDEELEIGEDFTLRMEPGAEVIIHDDVYILAFGDVFIEGTEEEPVWIHGTSELPGWGQLQVKGSAKNFVVSHALIEDGTMTSFDTNNKFDHVQFINKQNLTWEWAIARFWYGSLTAENCSMEGINKVEGFLLHDVHNSLLQKNTFFQVPDAIELLKCKNGTIRNNTMRNCNDDAIDLNGCTNILIEHNDIKDINNAGMEIGSENFGRSTGIQVIGNRMENCEIGILLKQSSDGVFELDSMISCQKGFDVTTPADSIIVSDAYIKQCFFSGNIEDVSKDERSIVIIED